MVFVRVVLAVMLVLIPASCTRAASVRDQILASKSPLIGDSWSSEGPKSTRPEVHVALLPETTVAEAERFWCEVVVPAGGTHDLSGVMVTLAIQGVAEPVAADTTCEQP